jgi:hypothetical protein
MAWKDFVLSELKTDELLGVPFVTNEPERTKVALTFEAYELLFSLKTLIRDLDEQIKSPRLMRLTRDRLKSFRDANADHFSILERLLRPLGHQSLPISGFNQGGQRRQSGYSLMQYYHHLFRDWEWGAAEVEASLALAQALLPERGDAQNALVLGAGACRFPYELHRRLGLAYTLCVDINPFLLSCAQRIVRGEGLELVEFPVLPLDAASFSRRATLQCAAPIREGFDFLVHDLEEWGFREKSFDLIVTHWVIDVIPMATARLFSLINRTLKPSGRWLNVGPVGFNKRVLALYYSAEEVKALVEKSEMKVLAQNAARVPYFQHPASAHWRTERVIGFLAQKTGECPVVGRRDPLELPEWLEDTQKPIQVPLDLENLSRSHAFCVDLLRRLERHPSVAAVAEAIAPAHGLTREQAEHLVENTLMQWLDGARHNPMRSLV